MPGSVEGIGSADEAQSASFFSESLEGVYGVGRALALQLQATDRELLPVGDGCFKQLGSKGAINLWGVFVGWNSVWEKEQVVELSLKEGLFGQVQMGQVDRVEGASEDAKLHFSKAESVSEF